MATVTAPSSRLLRRRNWRVYVNGNFEPQIEALRVRLVGGWQPCVCELSIPALLADRITRYDDQIVTVFEEGASKPIFRGHINKPIFQEDGVNSTVRLQAISIVGLLLTGVVVGQQADLGVRRFPMRNPVGTPDPTTGARPRSGWNIENVAYTILSSESLSAEWRALVSWGDTSALRRVRGDVELPDLSFPAEPVGAALRRLFSFAPDLGIWQEFYTNETTLNVFAYGDPGAGVLDLVAANGTTVNGPEDGASVSAYVAEADSSDASERCIAYGAPREWMVTLSSDPYMADGETANPLQLTPAWVASGGWQDASTSGLDPSELAVREQPNIGTFEAATGIAEDIALVYRAYRIPAALRQRYGASQSNAALEIASGGRTGIQVFMQKTEESADQSAAAAGETLLSVVADAYELVPGAKLDWDRGLLLLPKPALMMTSYRPGVGGGFAITYVPAKVYVTLTLFDRFGARPGYDTGTRGNVEVSGLESTGLVRRPFVNSACQLWSIGAAGLVDATGTARDIGATWYNEDTQEWSTVAAGSATIVRDDRPFLAALAERSIQQRFNRRHQVQIRVPVVMRGMRPGRVVRLLNRGMDDVRLTVYDVVLDLAGNSTTIRATDQVAAPRLDIDPSGALGARMAQQQRATEAAAAQPMAAMPAPAPEPRGSLLDFHNRQQGGG